MAESHTRPWRKQDGWPRGYGFIEAGNVMNDPIAYCSQLASTNHANGDLIAAAPELMAALEAIARFEDGIECWCRPMLREIGVTDHSGECDIIRAAIAKARGETQ